MDQPRPPANPNTPLMITLMGGIMAVMIAMVLAVFLATPHASQVATLPPSASSEQSGKPDAQPKPEPPGPAAPELSVLRTGTVPSATDVFDKAWDKAPSMEIPLQPQMIAMPMLETATVKSVQVQGLRDNQRIAWRLNWACAKPSANVDTSRFSDAVALQLPLSPDTPFMMGAPGKPVRVLHWKALWQKDIDVGFQDVQDLHPNYWADFYWFSEGKFPFPIAEAFKNPIARQWLVGVQAGNPMSNFQRKQPVEEIVAEGFGSATHLSVSLSGGKGVWRDGKWTVVLTRTLAPGDPLAAAIQSGTVNMISLAVWDGSAENVGGRKQYCMWVPMKVEP